MKEIELRIHDMSSTIHPADAYALVLVEVDGTRKLPVIIGHLEAQAIKSEMLKYKPPRPMTHDLFVQLGKHCDLSLHKVVIYQVKDGVYYSHMYFDANGEPFVLDADLHHRDHPEQGMPARYGRRFVLRAGKHDYHAHAERSLAEGRE